MRRGLCAFVLLVSCASFIYQSGVPILGSTWKGTSTPTIAYVQTFGTQFLSSSASPTFTYTSTSGDFVHLQVYWNSSTVALTSITSSCSSGSYTLKNNPTADTDNSERFAQGYSFENASGTCTITMNFGSAVSAAAIGVERSGVSVGTPVDGFSCALNDNGSGTGAAPTTGNFTTTANGDTISGIIMDIGAHNDVTTGSGFTGRQTTQTASILGNTEDKLQATAGAGTNANWTTSSGFRVTGACGLGLEP